MTTLKANDGSGNNIKRDYWETPAWLFDLLNIQYNFNFDCCSIESNTKAKEYSGFFEGVEKIMLEDKVCWMNPPFSKAKEMFIHFFKVVNKGVAIYRCDNLETRLWQDIIIPNVTWIFVPKGRVVYEGMNGSGSRFPSALVGVNVKKPYNVEGRLLLP